MYPLHNTILFSAKAQDTGVACYSKCGYQQGPCKYCWESSGQPLCCTRRKDFKDTSCGCDGNIGGLHVHECVAAPLIGKKQYSRYELWNHCKEIIYTLNDVAQFLAFLPTFVGKLPEH